MGGVGLDNITVCGQRIRRAPLRGDRSCVARLGDHLTRARLVELHSSLARGARRHPVCKVAWSGELEGTTTRVRGVVAQINVRRRSGRPITRAQDGVRLP